MSRTHRYSGPTKKAKRDRFYADQPNLTRLFEKEDANLRGNPGDPFERPLYPGALPSVPAGMNYYHTRGAQCKYCSKRLVMRRKRWIEAERRIDYVYDRAVKDYVRKEWMEDVQKEEILWFHSMRAEQDECKRVHKPKYEFMEMLTRGARA